MPLALITSRDAKRDWIYGGATITIDFESNQNDAPNRVEADADSGTIERANKVILNSLMSDEINSDEADDYDDDVDD